MPARGDAEGYLGIRRNLLIENQYIRVSFGQSNAGCFLPTFFTHKVPLDLFMQVIATKGKRAFLLGIQPGSVELFGGMTGEVAEAVKILKFVCDL
jgi:hypothetical protein